MNIQINVTDKRASVVGAPVIVCGNSDYLVDFSFDSEWSQAAAKTARFVYIRDGVVHHQDVVFDGTTAAVPVLVGIKEVRVGVFAGDLRTSTPALIPCELSIRCSTGAPEDPTPSQYDQIMALLAAGGGGGGSTGGGGTGSPGKDGEDGVSPTVAVENITGGHRVTITDADGAKSFDVMDGQDGQDGQPGKDGAAGQPGKDGEDGVSPTVAVTTIPGGHRVTITDASGVKYFDVMDGQDGEGGSTSGGGTGQDGADGVSPTVSVTTITGGHRVTIIDVDGAKSFDVMNGQDGQDGQDGQPGQDGAAGQDGADGVSPTVSVTTLTGGHRVTVTDANGSKTFDVMDGQAGQDGQDGAPGQPGEPGQDGQPGKDGTDGVSPTIAVTTITGGHRVTITGAAGAKSFDVMDGQDGQDGAAGATGATGQTGQTGPAGYTPVRGTDYWTPADVAEMKAHLDEKIINGEW